MYGVTDKPAFLLYKSGLVETHMQSTAQLHSLLLREHCSLCGLVETQSRAQLHSYYENMHCSLCASCSFVTIFSVIFVGVCVSL